MDYYISVIIKKPRMNGHPISISIEPTTACNLRCPQCISGLRSFTRPTGMMDKELYKHILLQLKNRLIHLTLYFQGEPFLNPAFYDMVEIADKNHLYTLTSTNGHYLSKENAEKIVNSGLDRIIISVDSFNQATYSKYRIGGNIETVKEGIRNLIHIRHLKKANKPYIILQFLIYRENESQLFALKKNAFRMGADKVEFKSMQIYDYKEGSDFIPENQKFSRYIKTEDGSYVVKSKYFNHCWKMWHSCVITWDARIVPCCFDKDAKHPMGSIIEYGDFMKIWKSDIYNEFRSRIFRDRSSIDICTNCTEGTKAWI
jgi:MoaA/NifB/PqqE/SkfB family radical SAM enzyme